MFRKYGGQFHWFLIYLKLSFLIVKCVLCDEIPLSLVLYAGVKVARNADKTITTFPIYWKTKNKILVFVKNL